MKTQRHGRSGLTLIELVVVLVILVALAGIVIPLLPSMVTRSHGAAGSTNIGEVAKLVQTYEALNYQYPDAWDAIVKDDGTEPLLTGGGAKYFQLGTEMQAIDLTDVQAEALEDAGITTLWHSVDTPGHATFNPYDATATAVAEDVKVVGLTPAGKLKLNLNAADTYVVLGLGGKCSMVGKGMVEAPVHFPDSPTEDPSTYYSRFAVVFKVNTSRAFPVAVVAFHDEGLSTAGDHMAEYFNAVNNK